LKRKIIKIDELKCNGCGKCIPNCPEGALKVIDGKVRLISDLFCDGLGACIGECPLGAIRVEERQAQEYDEAKVMANIIKQGENVIKAHLSHLEKHRQIKYLKQAEMFLEEKGIHILQDDKEISPEKLPASLEVKESELLQLSKCALPLTGVRSCPGARTVDFGDGRNSETIAKNISSCLSHWPVQLRLVSSLAPYFAGRDVVLFADCVGYAFGDFHRRFLQGKSLIIACPKLDNGLEEYVEKTIALVDCAKINTLTVIIMEVPCCGGLLRIAREAFKKASRVVPLKHIIIGIKGDILQEQWVSQ